MCVKSILVSIIIWYCMRFNIVINMCVRNVRLVPVCCSLANVCGVAFEYICSMCGVCVEGGGANLLFMCLLLYHTACI